MRKSVRVRPVGLVRTNRIGTILGVSSASAAGTVSRSVTTPVSGDNASRISAILAGRSPHFAYWTPADPIPNLANAAVTVTTADGFNAAAAVNGARIIINSSFSGSIRVGADDITVTMSNAATHTGTVSLGAISNSTNGTYINRLQWTGGNIGQILGARYRDVLFDDVYALAYSNVLDALIEHNFGAGWDGSGNPPFARLAIINSTLELQGHPSQSSGQMRWAFHSSPSYENQDLILANTKLLSNHQNNRFQGINRFLVVDSVFNPNGNSVNAMRVLAGCQNIWIRDSWSRSLFSMNVASNLVFDNYDRYYDLDQYVNQAGGGNSGTVQNSAMYWTGGSGPFSSISPLASSGNTREAWDGSTVPDYSNVGAIR
jgi:hypothetical protein